MEMVGAVLMLMAVLLLVYMLLPALRPLVVLFVLLSRMLG